MLWWLLQDGAGQALIKAVRSADFRLLVVAAVLAIVIQVVRAWRFSILTDGSMAMPSRAMMSIATRLILLNFILPFKLGELGFPFMMKRAFQTPLPQSTGILILSRLMDFGVVAAILLFAVAYLLAPRTIGLSHEIVVIAGLLIVMAPILLIDWISNLGRLTRSWPKLDVFVQQLSYGAVMIRPLPKRTMVLLLTCSIWILHAIIAYLTSLSIKAGIDFLPLAMASAASNLAFALPINGVAGLGPPQAAWAGMLNLAGVAWTPAITTALLCHGLLLITISTFGTFDYLREGIRPKISNASNGKRP